MTLTKRGLAVATIVAAMWLGAGPAEAHATLVSTSPEPGAVLGVAPEQVSVTFDDAVEVEEDSIRVVDAAGDQISGPATADGSSVLVDVPSDVEGWFAVSWQVVSVDGHPLSGGWTYRVGEGSDEAPDDLTSLAEGGQVASGMQIAWGVTQWVSTLAALALVGTAFVAIVTTPVDSQRTLVLILAAAAVTASILAAGSNGPRTATDVAWFDGPASTVYLARAALLGVGAGALWASWSARSMAVRLAAGGALIAGLCVTVLSGHARADGTVAVIVVMAHLVVAGAWLGATPAIVLGAWQGGEPARTTLNRFSRAAMWLAATVIVVGVAAAWMLSGGLGSIAPRWGSLLFLKIGLVVLAVLAGGWTRFNVLREWASRTIGQIRAPLLVEAVLLALIAGVSVGLTHNGPPEEYVAAGPVEMSSSADDAVVTIVLDPGQVGINDWHLYVTDPTGLPLDVEEAIVELSSTDLGIGPIVQELSDLGGGHFSGRTDDIGAAGTWEVRVVVRPTPFTQVVLEDSFELG